MISLFIKNKIEYYKKRYRSNASQNVYSYRDYSSRVNLIYAPEFKRYLKNKYNY